METNTETERFLTEEEIKYIIENSIIKTKFITDEVENQVISNITIPLFYALKTVLLLPSRINELAKEIKNHYIRARQKTNERVGFTATEALAAPLIQGSLNAFHSSGGLNENLIQRLTQILTATEQKNPYYILYIDEKKSQNLDKYIKQIYNVVLSDIVNMNEELIISIEDILDNNENFPYWYNVFINNYLPDLSSYFNNNSYKNSVFYANNINNIVRLNVSGLDMYKNTITFSRIFDKLNIVRNNEKRFMFVMSPMFKRQTTIQKIIRKRIYEFDIEEPYFYIDIFYNEANYDEREIFLNYFINNIIHSIQIKGIEKINYISKIEKNILSSLRFEEKVNIPLIFEQTKNSYLRNQTEFQNTFGDSRVNPENLWDINLNEQYIISNGIKRNLIRDIIKECNLEIVNETEQDLRIKINKNTLIDNEILNNLLSLDIILKYLIDNVNNIDIKNILIMIRSNMKPDDLKFSFKSPNGNKNKEMEEYFKDNDINLDFKNGRYYLTINNKNLKQSLSYDNVKSKVLTLKDIINTFNLYKIDYKDSEGIFYNTETKKYFKFDKNEFSFTISNEKLFKRNITKKNIIDAFNKLNIRCENINTKFYIIINNEFTEYIKDQIVGPIEIINYKIKKAENKHEEYIKNILDGIVKNIKNYIDVDYIKKINEEFVNDELRNEVVLKKLKEDGKLYLRKILNISSTEELNKEDSKEEIELKNLLNSESIKDETYGKILKFGESLNVSKEDNNLYLKSRFFVLRLDILQTKDKDLQRGDITQKIKKEKEQSLGKSKVFDKIMSELPFIDKTLSYSSDVNDNYRYFGIEAARNFTLLTIFNLIKGNGDYLNARHISLLADFMFLHGIVTKISSVAIVAQKVGFMEKISIGSIRETLQKCSGKEDLVSDISSCIMIGKESSKGVIPNEKNIEIENLTKAIEEMEEVKIEEKHLTFELLNSKDIVRILDKDIKTIVEGIDVEIDVPEIEVIEDFEFTLF